MNIMPYWQQKDKRLIGIQLIYRQGDWVYLDIHWWFGGCMINLFRVQHES